MLAYLEGDILFRGDGFVIVKQGGIGYKITLPNPLYQTISSPVALFLHEAQREDGRELLGFVSVEQLELFWKLISVSGVGPKSGQKIVFAGTVEEMRAKIMAGDVSALTHVQGVGTKTAQKIILELKGVLTDIDQVSSADTDAVDALVSLGYGRKDAIDALAGTQDLKTEEKIRYALKRLSH